MLPAGWGLSRGAGDVLACIGVAAGSLPMVLYHRTNAADDILRDGFRDGEGSYMSDVILRGVWLSAVPLGDEEGARGNQVLEVDLPDALAIEHEVVEEGRQFREFLVPADLLNRQGRARLLSQEEVDAIDDPRFRPPDWE
jgi:hypothetical protein